MTAFMVLGFIAAAIVVIFMALVFYYTIKLMRKVLRGL